MTEPDLTDEWLDVFEQGKQEGDLTGIFFRLVIYQLPLGVDAEDPRVIAAIEEIRKANEPSSVT